MDSKPHNMTGVGGCTKTAQRTKDLGEGLAESGRENAGNRKMSEKYMVGLPHGIIALDPRTTRGSNMNRSTCD
jgi:hypothetical protein